MISMTEPASIAQLMLAAQDCEHRSQWAHAEQIYREILRLQPDFHRAWHALAILAVHAEQWAHAAQLVEQALGLDASVGLYWRNLGELRRRLQQLPEALDAARRASELLPGDPLAWYNLGLAAAQSNRLTEAEQAYRQALALAPDSARAWNNLGSLLQQRDLPDDRRAAEQAYGEAIRLEPTHLEAHNNLGALYAEQGHLDAARQCFQAALALRADSIEAHFNLAALHTYRHDDPYLSMLTALHDEREQLPTPLRVRYQFALGKALDDTDQVERAFAAYAEGNRLQHASLAWDETRQAALVDQILALFTPRFMAQRAAWRGVQDPRTPVFIVGMPRSGTTLIEQILSTQPGFHGAGELPEFGAVLANIAGSQPYPINVQWLDEDSVRRIGMQYLENVWQLAPDSRLISDKMPANFFYLGLIHLALPGARIIHALRDPMDACFSCYTRLFDQTMSFAYDQQTLGRYYVRYRRLMAHWHQVLPAGVILDLTYEELVADPQTQARRLLEHVGLPWDPACLDFHQQAREVKTASVVQVRQPLYRSSVARWTRYARHLQPLYQIVRDWREPWRDSAQTRWQVAHMDVEPIHQAGIEAYHRGQFEQALERFDQALEQCPDAASIHNSKGFVLQDLGHTEAARDCFAQALTLAPELDMARLNLGLAQLKLGDWAPGWDHYEARWNGAAEAATEQYRRPACPLPQWTGQARQGSAAEGLLVIVEQGYGDTLQFCRYLHLLQARFARLALACTAPMLRLMQDSFGEQVVVLEDLPADFTTWDWHCPIMSLPRACATRVATVPASSPYLQVPSAARRYWQDRLVRAAGSRLRVGLAWAGRGEYRYDARRSLAFTQLEPLLDDPRVAWISLQKWQPEGFVAPASGLWLDWTGELTDFAASAALIANLDLVISVDSVTVHLAGALDVPVWMLDRFDNEWRWLKDRLDSPWYPRLRIFRQARFGDWPPVLEQVRQALNDHLVQSR
jgi:Flp pilus assembly protein TadD